MENLKHIIKSENGVHARPAGYLAEFANRFSDVCITIVATDKQCDARSILSVMKLGLKQNDEVTFNLNGPSEDRVVEVKNALSNFLATNF